VASSPPSPVQLSTPSKTSGTPLVEDSETEKMTASEEEKEEDERPGVNNLFPQDDEERAGEEDKVAEENISPRAEQNAVQTPSTVPLSVITPSLSLAPSIASPRQVARTSPKKEAPSSIEELRSSLSLLQSRLQVLGAAPGSQELKALCKELGVDERLRLVVSSASKASKLVTAEPPLAPSPAAKNPHPAQVQSPSVAAAVVEVKTTPRSPRPAAPGLSTTPVPSPSSANKCKDKGTSGSGDGSGGKRSGRKPVEHISPRLLAPAPLPSTTAATGPASVSAVSDSIKGPPAPATPLTSNASTSKTVPAGINTGSSTKAKHTSRIAVGRSASATRSRPTTVERTAPLPSAPISATQSTPGAAARSKSVPRQAPSASSASAGTTMEARRALVEASRAQRLAAAEKAATATAAAATTSNVSATTSAAQRRALVEASRQAREAKAKAAVTSSAPPPALASSSGSTRKAAVDRVATAATPSRAPHATPSRSNGQSHSKPADPISKLSSTPLSARKHQRVAGAVSTGGVADGGTSLMLSAMPPPSSFRPKSSFPVPSGPAVTPVRKPSAPTPASTSGAVKQPVGVALTPRSGITVTLTPRAALQAVVAENPFGALL